MGTPGTTFDALIGTLAGNDAPQADPDLEVVRLAYLYDAEVLDGGHLQYFAKRGTKDGAALIAALEALGEIERAILFRACLDAVLKSPLPTITAVGFSVLAQERWFRDADLKYRELRPPLLERLQAFIAPRLAELVALRG